HRHNRRAPPYGKVAVLHTDDVAAEVLQWVAQEVPVEVPAPLRPLWLIPRSRLLFVVVLKPPDRVELLQERLACSSSDRLCFKHLFSPWTTHIPRRQLVLAVVIVFVCQMSLNITPFESRIWDPNYSGVPPGGL